MNTLISRESCLTVWQKDADEAYRLKRNALALHALGRKEEADDALAMLIKNWGAQWPSEVAHVYAYRRDLDNAFLWLEKEYET